MGKDWPLSMALVYVKAPLFRRRQFPYRSIFRIK